MQKLVFFLLLILISGCIGIESYKTKASIILMGTNAEITVIDKDKAKAENAVQSAFNEIKRIDELMSIYNNKTQISILNNNGFLENTNKEVLYIISKSDYYSELSNGAFDITVQPILDLYKKSFSELKRQPTDEEIKKTLELVDYRNIIVNGSTIKFNKKDMKITLGGIAKGYAVDKAIEVIEKNGITNALVNIGGDLRVIGTKGKEKWSIALQNPRNKEDYITIIKLYNKSVATSGDYERYFDLDKKFHHIINPKTGYSATELISVTIIADIALDADAIATSVFVLGPEKGLNLIGSLENVEGLLITKDREIIKSKGFIY